MKIDEHVFSLSRKAFNVSESDFFIFHMPSRGLNLGINDRIAVCHTFSFSLPKSISSEKIFQV